MLQIWKSSPSALRKFVFTKDSWVQLSIYIYISDTKIQSKYYYDMVLPQGSLDHVGKLPPLVPKSLDKTKVQRLSKKDNSARFLLSRDKCRGPHILLEVNLTSMPHFVLFSVTWADGCRSITTSTMYTHIRW